MIGYDKHTNYFVCLSNLITQQRQNLQKLKNIIKISPAALKNPIKTRLKTDTIFHLLTEWIQPILRLLRSEVQSGLIADVDPGVGLEGVQRIHTLQLDADRQQLQHWTYVQHEAIAWNNTKSRYFLIFMLSEHNHDMQLPTSYFCARDYRLILFIFITYFSSSFSFRTHVFPWRNKPIFICFCLCLV